MSTRRHHQPAVRSIVLALLLLACPLSTSAVAVADTSFAVDEQTPQQVTISDVSVTGSDTLEDNETKRFWLGSSMNVSLSVSDEQDRAWSYDVCADAGGNSTCKTLTVENETKSVTLSLEQNLSAGRHDILIRANNSIDSSTQSDSVSVPITVVDPNNDADDDGLHNRREYRLGLNMTNPDTDGDTLSDGEEVTNLRTDPLLKDTDQDGLTDEVEVNGPTNATLADTDGDGLDDGFEREHELDPTSQDTDNDTLLDKREFEGKTDPRLADTDDDGLGDAVEVAGPTNATDPDTDGDGVTDGREHELGLNATNPDTDGDFLRDGLELTAGTNPNSALQTLVLGFVALLVVGVISVVLPVQLLRRIRSSGTDSTDDQAGAASTTDETTADSQSSPDTADEQPTSSEPDPELLPPKERVQRLLAAENDRMRQSELVEATEWSKAKVSRTLSEMEDDGTVTRYRLGRENVVTLGDAESEEHLGPKSGPG